MSIEALSLNGIESVQKFPELPKPSYGFFGRIVYWIRDANNHGVLWRTIVTTTALVVSLLMIVSIVLSPLFIITFREYIKQNEKARYDAEYKEVLAIAKDQARQNFMRGRLAPLRDLDVKFWPFSNKRKKLIQLLDLPPQEAKKYSNIELVRMVALRHNDFIHRCNLTLS